MRSEFHRQGLFQPVFSGTLHFESVPVDAIDRMEQRVRNGFVLDGNRARNSYETARTEGSLRITACDYFTAANVGLNDVTIVVTGEGRVDYIVRFDMWRRYCIRLCAMIAAMIMVTFVVMWLAGNGHLIDVAGAGFWVGVLNLTFWGFAWPYVLAELHKRQAARCLERILRETLEVSSSTETGEVPQTATG